jgi:transposase
LIVANAHHIKTVPGRKTDVKDAEWIADLVRHGLVRSSFVPPPEIRELRDLLRHRRTLAETLASERNRTLKLLEMANIKLSSVATDVFGVSGTAMLKALVEGDMAPEAMAELAKGRLRTKLEPLVKALQGRLTEHYRFLLRLHLRRLEEIDRDLAELEARMADRMKPFRRQVGLLKRIPGVDEIMAAEIIAEIGLDMTVFGNARRLAAWAGVCPGNHESAGRQRKTSTRKGNLYLKATLFRAAVCAAKAKGTYYKEKYYRLKARLGAKRAAMAIASVMGRWASSPRMHHVAGFMLPSVVSTRPPHHAIRRNPRADLTKRDPRPGGAVTSNHPASSDPASRRRDLGRLGR